MLQRRPRSLMRTTSSPGQLQVLSDLSRILECSLMHRSGSVEKNTPHLTKAHDPLLSESSTNAVLEIASGFLDHCSSYARQHSEVQFWPTECNDYLVGQLESARQASGLPNIQPAQLLDVLNGRQSGACQRQTLTLLSADDHWESLRNLKAAPFDVVTVTNLLNVSPWSV
jgi:hypothetical protein